MQTQPSGDRRSLGSLLLLAVCLLGAGIAWHIVLQKPTAGRPVSAALPPPPAPPSPEVANILTKMAAAYAGCRSYTDTGTVSSVAPARPEFSYEKRFQIAFVRPDRFFFVYITEQGTPKDTYAIWSNGQKSRIWVHAWWSREGKTSDYTSLGDAMKRPASLSGGSSQTVPRLLLPGDIGGWSLTQLIGPHLLGTESVDGAACFKLLGSNPHRDAITIWVDTRRFLLRKVSIASKVVGSDAVTTARYHPQIDLPVDAKRFAFTPSKI